MKGIIVPTLEDLNELKEKIQSRLNSDYEVCINVVVTAAVGIFKYSDNFDIVIFYKGEAIVAIEYKSRFQSLVLIRYPDHFIEKFKKVGLRCGVVYFGKNNEFNVWHKEYYKFVKLDFDSLITSILENRHFGERPLIDEVTTEVLSCITPEYSEQIALEHHRSLDDLFSENTIVYDDQKGEVSLKLECEDKFFKLLLHQKESNIICRYTSLNSLFNLLKDNKHAMCSITCMNDKSESYYTEKHMGHSSHAESVKTIEANNNCFILSCTDKRDDLTMWRLYGDDAKGVCLQYQIDESLIDNDSFFWGPISYGQDDKTHYELDFIRNINNLEINGWKFVFKRWDIWKHFFKSHLFKDENEFRLLYINKDSSNREDVDIKWIMESKNNIVSRICLFSLDNDKFPLKLNSAIIGPKCPEKHTNVAQFAYMNSQTKTIESGNKESIIPSSISDYR